MFHGAKCYRVCPVSSTIMCAVRAELCIAICLVAAVASRARADERDEARQEFAAGQDADKLGHWDEAIEHYLHANRLLPHPFTLFNIAVDYEHLGKSHQAAVWYRRYLEADPDSPDRDRIQKAIHDLQAHPTPLSVRSTPEGALVTIDGQRIGVTPLYIKVPGGTRHVEVDLDGQIASRDIDIDTDDPVDVLFPLGGASGTLSVGGAPQGAYVAIDNITVGVVPSTTQISPGNHTVRVTAAGYAPFQTVAVVTPNGDAHVDAKLAPAATVTAGAPVPANANNSMDIALLVGAFGGVEAESNGGFEEMGMFGTRISRYDVLFRAGRAHGGLALDFIVRVNFLAEHFTPFVAAGYGYADGNYAYIAQVGLRYDVVHTPRNGISIVLDGGVRYITAGDDTDDTTTTTSTTSSGTVTFPIELGVEALFR